MQDSILNTVVTTIDGEVTTLEKYTGNVLLIVNVPHSMSNWKIFRKRGPTVALLCWAFPAISSLGRNLAVMTRSKPGARRPGA